MKIQNYVYKVRLEVEGKDKLFNTIWNDYYRKLYYYITSRFGLAAEAADLMQDIMVKIYNNLDKYNPAYSLATYIYTIARNYCIDYMRKEQRAGHHLGDDDVQALAGRQDIEQDMIAEDMKDRIGTCLQAVKPENRELFYLKVYERLSYKEIGHILDMTPEKAKSRFFQVKTFLKNEFKEYQ